MLSMAYCVQTIISVSSQMVVFAQVLWMRVNYKKSRNCECKVWWLLRLLFCMYGIHCDCDCDCVVVCRYRLFELPLNVILFSTCTRCLLSNIVHKKV